MKHLRASCFHPPQPSLSTSGLRPPIFVTGKERKLETKGKDCNKQQKFDKMYEMNHCCRIS